LSAPFLKSMAGDNGGEQIRRVYDSDDFSLLRRPAA